MTDQVPGTWDPLPFRYVFPGPGTRGVIKQRPEDFMVQEIPLFEPGGHGEHLYLRVQKRGISHSEAVHALSKCFAISDRAIGYAGMKDKHAVTQQTFSIHTPNDPPLDGELNENLEIVWSTRHHHKLRRGQLLGNRFSIYVRQVEPTMLPGVMEEMRQLEQAGVPNLYGSQRFGYRQNSHLLGQLVLKNAWQEILHEVLGSRGTPFPDHQASRRRLYDDGAYQEAFYNWSPSDWTERRMLSGLMKNLSARRIVLGLRRPMIGFWTSAFQSSVFNHVVAARHRTGTLTELFEGDIAWNHRARRPFTVDEKILADPATAERLATLEITPTGPMWGTGMMRARGRIDDMELAALAETGVTMDDLSRAPIHLRGTRRALVIKLINAEADAGVDEHGAYIRVCFDLPRGSYATVVLEQLMRSEYVDPDL